MMRIRLDQVPSHHTPAIVAALGAFLLVFAYWSWVRPPRNVFARAAAIAACAFTIAYGLVTLDIDYSDPASVACIGSALVVCACLLYELRAARAIALTARTCVHDRRRQRVWRRARIRAAARADERQPDRIAS